MTKESLVYLLLVLSSAAAFHSDSIFTIQRVDEVDLTNWKNVAIDGQNKTNQQVASTVFDHLKKDFPSSSWLVLVYNAPPSYGEYRQLMNSFVDFGQLPGRYTVIYKFDIPTLTPLDKNIQIDINQKCEEFGYIALYGWYTVCSQTYYTDWVGWQSDPYWSCASWLYDDIDGVLAEDFKLLVTRKIPTTYGNTDVHAVWSDNVPVLKIDKEGFIILVGDMFKAQQPLIVPLELQAA